MSLHPVHVPTRDEVIRAYTKPTPRALSLVCLALAVVGTLAFAQNLLAESALSYLGLGPPAPAASWGRMLYDGKAYYRTSPHLIIAPGLAILLAVVAFNLLGEGLRDVLDPRGRRR